MAGILVGNAPKEKSTRLLQAWRLTEKSFDSLIDKVCSPPVLALSTDNLELSPDSGASDQESYVPCFKIKSKTNVFLSFSLFPRKLLGIRTCLIRSCYVVEGSSNIKHVWEVHLIQGIYRVTLHSHHYRSQWAAYPLATLTCLSSLKGRNTNVRQIRMPMRYHV